MPYTASGIVSHGFPQAADPFTFTYLVSGVAATDDAAAALAGKAVSLNTAAANTVKLAADGEAIFGRVFQGENRGVLGVVTASVQRKFKEKLPAASGHGIDVGDSVVGAGGGLVRLADTGVAAEVTASRNNIVVETGTDYVVVESF
jgi:hypothetical protein